jgi:hypothetical protein
MVWEDRRSLVYAAGLPMVSYSTSQEQVHVLYRTYTRRRPVAKTLTTLLEIRIITHQHPNLEWDKEYITVARLRQRAILFSKKQFLIPQSGIIHNPSKSHGVAYQAIFSLSNSSSLRKLHSTLGRCFRMCTWSQGRAICRSRCS